jgi:hypothetical protein
MDFPINSRWRIEFDGSNGVNPRIWQITSSTGEKFEAMVADDPDSPLGLSGEIRTGEKTTISMWTTMSLSIFITRFTGVRETEEPPVYTGTWIQTTTGSDAPLVPRGTFKFSQV